MSGDDVHTPIHAGPTPLLAPTGAAPAPEPAAAPTAAASAPADSPEVIVGAAFAGGLIAALILKRLVR